MTQETATKVQNAALQELATGPCRREATGEEIGQRAYEIYLERGAAPGFELDDWLQAESELRKRSADPL